MQHLAMQALKPTDGEDRRAQSRGGGSRRLSPRQRTLLSGYIVPVGSDDIAEVVVRNLSETGARLSLKEAAPVEGDFLLLIPTRSVATAARVVWGQGPDLGVQFKDAEADAATRLAKLSAILQR